MPDNKGTSSERKGENDESKLTQILLGSVKLEVPLEEQGLGLLKVGQLGISLNGHCGKMKLTTVEAVEEK